jgi:hypothetical protein
MLRQEIRIKDARMTQIAPQRRPHYPSTERMAILELKAARIGQLAIKAPRGTRHSDAPSPRQRVTQLND